MNTAMVWILVIFFGPNNVVTVDDISSRPLCEQLAKDITKDFQRDYFIKTECFSVRKYQQ